MCLRAAFNISYDVAVDGMRRIAKYWLGSLHELMLGAALLIFPSCAYGQTNPLPGASPLPDPTSTARKNDDKNYGYLENEMRDKRFIEEEKKRYAEHVGRARELFQLASQINQSFE